jgi:hypothetical protein
MGRRDWQPHPTEDLMTPEALERQLEGAPEPAESFVHFEEPLFEALRDEGPPFEGPDAEELEYELGGQDGEQPR